MSTIIEPGTIIIFNEKLGDPFLSGAVVLILTHGDEGSKGVNLAGDLLGRNVINAGPQFDTIQVFHDQVQRAGAHPVGKTGYAIESCTFGNGRLQPADLIDRQTSLVLIGCAAWGAGELSYELKLNVWKIGPIRVEDLLSVPADQRWALADGSIE